MSARPGPPRTLVIACGALAREYVALARQNAWNHLEVACLPASLHNRPERIAEAVRRKIRAKRAGFDRVLVLYADCGTGGLLDRVLEEEGAERIEGAHCYEFYLGGEEFERVAEEDPATFFLTDYLVRHFDRLIVKGLGLDRYPELLPAYFGNYRRVIYLAQTHDPDLTARAEKAAARLGLPLETRFTGLSGIERFLAREPA
ncbi:MAG TPA: DUF1638 domain-containing protein [Beijerinckiaceae bacterium]|nr:DUF1638 domain-containing protein [Beijerinckiaceae bacterium]